MDTAVEPQIDHHLLYAILQEEYNKYRTGDLIEGSWEDVDRSTSTMHLFHLGMLSPLIPLLIYDVAGLNIVLPRQTLGGNTSALLPGWNVNPGIDCLV